MPFLAEVPWFFTHIFPWGFIVAGGSYSLDALLEVIRASESHRWPMVEGKVTRSTVEEVEFDEHGHTTHVPRVEYAYEVGGREFKGTCVTIADNERGSKEAALAFLKRLPLGAKVEVRYLPAEPKTALLQPGIRPRLIVKLVFALLTLGLGVAMFFFMPLLGKLEHGTL